MTHLSNVGGPNDVNDINVSFNDSSAISLPDEGQITDTQYKPTQGTSPTDPGHVVQPTYPSPAPAGPYATSLSAFDGTNPKGIWDLYIVDAAAQDIGQIARGWDLFITTDAPPDTTPPQGQEHRPPKRGHGGLAVGQREGRLLGGNDG